MNKRWIITGANGYLGTQLCIGLHHRGGTVQGIMRAGKSHNALEALGISCHTYDELPSSLSKGDILVHCAGKVGNIGDWDEFERINIDWTVSLFDQATEGGVSCFIYVSSVAALGYKNRHGSDELIDESCLANLFEGEFYGRSKWFAEQSLIEHAGNTSVRLIILRPGLIYGKRPFATPQTWIKRGTIVDPGQRVPLVHINSFIEAVAGTANNPEAEGVFFVVDEEQPTLRDLNALKIQHGILRYHPWRIGKVGFWLLYFFRAIARNMGGRRATVQKGYALAQYHFYRRRLQYSTDRLRNLVGWTPTISLAEGLKDFGGALQSKEKS